VDGVGGVVDRVASLEGVRDAVGNDLAAAVQHVVDLLAVVAVCRRAAAGVDLDDPHDQRPRGEAGLGVDEFAVPHAGVAFHRRAAERLRRLQHDLRLGHRLISAAVDDPILLILPTLCPRCE
jgi:hypothetical protein